jgi:hypothetical protein
LSSRAPKAHATAAGEARRIFADQFDSGAIERFDHFGERIDHAPHIARTRLHPLDGRQRHAGQFGKLTLIDAEQGSGGAHLEGGDHGASTISNAGVSHIAIDVKNINILVLSILNGG